MNVKMSTDRMRTHFKELYGRWIGTENREEMLRALGKGALLTVYTYLIASTRGLFDTFPFALALLASLSERIGFAFTGAALGAMFGRGFSLAMLIGYAVIFLVRTQIVRFLTEDKGAGRTEEPLVLRCVLSAAVALSVTGFPMIGNFTYYGLFGAFFMTFACPALTLVFSGAFMRGRTSALFSEGGWWLLRFCLVFACLELSIFGFVPALAVAVLISVLEYTGTNPISACFSGFFSGLAIGVNYGVLIAALSLVGGIVHQFNKKLSVGAGLLAGMAYAYATMGNNALFVVFPDLVCGGLLAVPFGRLRSVTEVSPIPEPASAAMQYLDNEEEALRDRQEESTVKSMHRLSQVFFTLTGNRLPDGGECEMICQNRMKKHCGVCKGAVYCRGENETARKDAFDRAAKALHIDGRVDGRFLADVGCMYSAEIAEELAVDYAKLYRVKSEPQAADAYAAGFDAVSRLLSEQKEQRRRARMPREELAIKISEKARRLGLGFSTVGVYGAVRKSVFFCDCKTADCRTGAEGLRKALEEILGGRLSYPRTVVGAKGSMLVLESIPVLTLHHAEVNKPKRGQKICGDRVHSFLDASGNPCLLLCDGMGSGPQAAIAASIGCSLSECLSEAGATPKLITELLNTALRHRPGEDSCSFDLFSFDRYSGAGVFIKNGAAPTLVFRSGVVYKLSAGTLPLGIVTDAVSEQIRMQMQDGDLVIMASDGIAADFEDAAALAAIVNGHEDESAEELARHILEECTNRIEWETGTRKSDDMSVCVVKIEKAP